MCNLTQGNNLKGSKECPICLPSFCAMDILGYVVNIAIVV